MHDTHKMTERRRIKSLNFIRHWLGTVLYYNGFVHTLLKFPNTNIFIKAFIKQKEYEENLLKINLSQGVTLIKRNNNVSSRLRNSKYIPRHHTGKEHKQIKTA